MLPGRGDRGRRPVGGRVLGSVHYGLLIKPVFLNTLTVHFDRWLHFARSLCLKNKVTMTLIGTEEMMGDMFTKALDKTKFLKCRDYIMTEGH